MAGQFMQAIPPLAVQNGIGLGDFIASIGRQQFEQTLLKYLNDNCGADHVALFQFGQRGAERFASISLDGTDTANRQTRLYVDGQYWRSDPSVLQAQQDAGDFSKPVIYRLDIAEMPMSDLRDLIYRRMHIRERVLICGRGPEGVLGLSILRSEKRGAFSEQEIDGLTNIANILLSVLEKHCEMKWQGHRLSLALTSLDEIQRCCVNSPDKLPRREVEVCARILYGLSTVGIALDLGIGEETVMTYRKRIYQRLSISSHRELLLWYLALWSEVGSGYPRA